MSGSRASGAEGYRFESCRVPAELEEEIEEEIADRTRDRAEYKIHVAVQKRVANEDPSPGVPPACRRAVPERSETRRLAPNDLRLLPDRKRHACSVADLPFVDDVPVAPVAEPPVDRRVDVTGNSMG
jgi:hypothetical protein